MNIAHSVTNAFYLPEATLNIIYVCARIMHTGPRGGAHLENAQCPSALNLL